jgi:hypothetical protein
MLLNNVADPYHIDADPDPPVHFDVDPDPSYIKVRRICNTALTVCEPPRLSFETLRTGSS